MRKLMVTLLLSGLAMAASASVEEKFKASSTSDGRQGCLASAS